MTVDDEVTLIKVAQAHLDERLVALGQSTNLVAAKVEALSVSVGPAIDGLPARLHTVENTQHQLMADVSSLKTTTTILMGLATTLLVAVIGIVILAITHGGTLFQ